MNASKSTHMLWIRSAWRTLELRCPVKLCAIASERHYKAMTDFMNELLDEVGDNRSHSLTGLLDAVTSFVRDYEEEHMDDPKPPPAEVLRLLMDQQGVGLVELARLFDSAESVMNVTTGLCPIAPRQARALGKRFGVPASVFL